MTPENLSQRMTVLAGATVPILRRLKSNAPPDSAGLLADLDVLSNAYHSALQGGMALAHDWAAQGAAWEETAGLTTEEALAAVRRVTDKFSARPFGVGENGR